MEIIKVKGGCWRRFAGDLSWNEIELIFIHGRLQTSFLNSFYDSNTLNNRRTKQVHCAFTGLLQLTIPRPIVMWHKQATCNQSALM